MTRYRLVSALVIIAALVAGIGADALVRLSEHEERPEPLIAFLVLVCWLFVGTGLVARARAQDSRFGWLLIAVGLTWSLGALSESNHAVLFTAGLLLQPIWIVPFGYAVLVYPEARLEGHVAKLTFGVLLATCTIIQWFAVLFTQPNRDVTGCGRCPANLLLVASDGAVYDAISALQGTLAALLALAVGAVAVRRYRRASAALRRQLAPVLAAIALFAGGLLALQIADATLSPSEGVDTIVTVALFALVPLAFLASVLRAQLSHAAVGTLLVELREGAPGGLVEALRRALRDPSLEVAYWLPEAASYVTAEGAPMAIEVTPERAARVVEQRGERVAAIAHDPSLDQQPALLDAVCAAAGLTLANERLAAELRARLADLRASRARLVEAGDAERRRIERNLHDGAQQRLVSLSLRLRLLETTLHDGNERSGALLGEAARELDAAIVELRELARGIHPAALDRGLEPALQALVGRAPLPVELRYGLPVRAPAAVETAAYYVIAEALANVAHHAQATHAEVAVEAADGMLVVTVRDDGRGGASAQGGSGLRGLLDRVEALDGRLGVHSPPSEGTQLTATLPLVTGS